MSKGTADTEPLLDATTRNIIEHDSDIADIHPINYNTGQELDLGKDWSPAYRRGVAILLAAISFTSTFTCLGIAPFAAHIVREVGGQQDKLRSILFVTIWELGEATGPMIIAPLSEIYGRRMAFSAANAFFIIGVLLTGISQNVDLLIFARFLTGSAVAHNVLNPAIIRDMFPSHELGSVISSVMLAIPLGGVLSPLYASALADHSDWRNIIWTALMMATTCQVGLFTFFQETYKPQKFRLGAATARIAADEQREELLSAIDNGRGAKSALWLSVLRPAHLLYESTLLQTLSVWGGMIYTSFYIMVTTLPGILEDRYNFSSGLSSASLASLSVGSIIGIVVSNISLDTINSKLRGSEETVFYPEARLTTGVVAAIMVPLILTVYGCAAELRWPVEFLLVAVASFGCFFSLALVSLTTYITDAFNLYSASAMTAILTTRCVMGTFLPLIIAPMIGLYGYGWALMMTAACILGLAIIPATVVLFGPSWRQRSRHTKSQRNI